MSDVEKLRTAIADLIKVLQLQAKETERLILQLEQQTDLRIFDSQLPLVVSELSELHHRIKKLEMSA